MKNHRCGVGFINGLGEKYSHIQNPSLEMNDADGDNLHGFERATAVANINRGTYAIFNTPTGQKMRQP